MKTLFLCLTVLGLISGGIPPLIKSIHFKQNVGGYVERAAYANTVESAKPELDRAIQAAEEANLTSGFTSVWYRTPDEDVGFWYQNMVNSQAELAALAPDAPALEKSNVLMKLRESLTIDSKEGEKLRIPNGLAYHPNNLGFGILRIIWGLSLVAIFFAFRWWLDS